MSDSPATDAVEAEPTHISLAGRAALLMVAALPVLALYGFGIALPPLARAFADNPNAVLLSQLVGGVVGFALALSSPIVGWLIDRFSYRTVLLFSCAAFALAGSVGGILDNLYLILATRLLLGVTVAGALIAALTGIGTLPPRQRAQMFGFQSVAGAMLAIGCFPLVGAFAAMGWRWPFALHLVGLLVIPVALTLPRTRSSGPKTERSAPSSRLAGLSVGFLLVAAFMGMVSILGSLFAPFFLIGIGISDPNVQAYPLMAMAAAGMAASSFYGFLHGRIGTVGMFALAISTAGIGFLVGAFAGTLAALTLSLVITAMGVSLCTPNLSAASVEYGGQDAGKAIGLMSAAMYGSQALFPFVAGVVNKAAGPNGVFALFGLAAISVGAAFGLMVIRTRAGARSIPA